MSDQMTRLEKIRHSCAHVLADAVLRLFPTAKLAIGPVIENGFYYDFDYEAGFTPDDFIKIKKVMSDIIAANHRFERREVAKADALDYFTKKGEIYKVEIINELPGDSVTYYQDGEFVDLCKGPHTESTGDIKAFELLKVAGAYWRGSEKNKMLQRIYGTAFESQADLDAYLAQLEEAEKRDHRRLGKALDLFHMQEEAPGMVFWHPKGWQLYRTVQNYVRRRIAEFGYQEIRTPQIVDRSLWERSGHWDKYRDAMYTTHVDERDFAIKPMNCPCHIQVYNHTLHSYRDLPLRLAEFGSCHRYEPSGTLHGLMRVRGFVQDDAHIFCTEDQIQGEAISFIDLLFSVYRDFGFTDVSVNLSTRPEKRVGDEALWDKAEKALETVLNEKKLTWTLKEGDGAFYGPKIDFSLRDSIGRVWQLGTLQLDFSMPGRLGAEYVAADGSRQTPVMLHRAVLGSLERFVGVLIEHHAAVFPLWLSPVQVKVLNIGADQHDYAMNVVSQLKQAGLRVEIDDRNEKLGLKIREATMQKVPYVLVVGGKEKESGSVAVRSRDHGDLGVMTISACAEKLMAESPLIGL